MTNLINIRLFIITMLSLVAISAHATTVLKMPLQQLTKSSGSVVTGTIVDQETKWDATGKNLITYSTLKVEEVVRGNDQSRTIKIAQPGGTLGDVVQVVHGMQLLRLNQSFLLFLEKDGTSPARKVTGFTQGIYHIRRDSSGTLMAVPSSGSNLEYYSKGVSGKLTESSDDRQARPLNDMLQSIRAVK